MPQPEPAAADREVLEAAADEAEHLVAPEVGLDELGVIGVVALEPLLVRRQAEEPVLLGQPLEGHVGVVRADRPARRLDHLGGGPKALVRAVPALVRAEVEVAVGVGPADHLLGRPDVVRVGRPDEPVGGDEESVSARLNSSTVPSTNARGVVPSSAARWAMFTECSSVPVRKRVSCPTMRCQRAMASAPITSYRVCSPGRLLA